MKSPSQPARKEAIVVLGMHRSGTSAMARTLSLAGCQLPSNLMPAAFDNPTGHWEPQDIADFNDTVLTALDITWDETFGPRMGRSKGLATKPHLVEARRLLRENYGDSDLIVLKEPRIALLHDLWLQALVEEDYNPNFVIMIRSPLEVSASLNARNGINPNRSLLIWTTNMLASEISTRPYKRVFVKYGDLLEDPEGVLDRIEVATQLTFPRRTWDSNLEIQEFIRSDLRHHTIKFGSGRTKIPPQIKKLYDFLEAASRGEDWNVDITKETADWLDQLESTFAPILKQQERDARRSLAQSDDERRQAEAAATATIESHRAREAELEQAIGQLQSEAVEARSAAAALDAELRQALEEAQTLAQTEASALAEQVRALELALADAQSHANNLSGALDLANIDGAARASELEARLGALQEQSEAYRQVAEEREQALLSLQTRLEEIQSELAARHVLELEASRTALTLAAEEKIAEMERLLEAKREDFIAREAELLAEADRARSERREAELKAASLEAAISDLRAQQGERDTQAASRLEQLQEQLAATEQRAGLALDEAQALTQELSAARAQIDSAVQRADDLSNMLAEHDAAAALRVAALTGEVQTATRKAGELSGELGDARASLAARDQELQHQREQAAAELKAMQDQSAELARAVVEAVARRQVQDKTTAAGFRWPLIRRLWPRAKGA